MIAILMSTYNGSRYIREQIESIIAQTYSDWKLYIRDDGSKDNTASVIKEYVNKFPDKIKIVEDVPQNMGAGESFMFLLKIIEADYYMFSDQDDVWLPTKIEKTFDKLLEMESKYGKETAIGVFTDLTVVNSRLEPIMPSLWKGDHRHPEYVRDFYMQWTNRHASYGCTQMFNRSAKASVLPYKQFEGVMGAHDNWLEYILIKQGKYDYLDESTILYRQHESNVVGSNFGHTYKEDISGIIHKPSDLWKKLRKDYKRSRLLPFKISYAKVLWYRTIQSIQAIIGK